MSYWTNGKQEGTIKSIEHQMVKKGLT